MAYVVIAPDGKSYESNASGVPISTTPLPTDASGTIIDPTTNSPRQDLTIVNYSGPSSTAQTSTQSSTTSTPANSTKTNTIDLSNISTSGFGGNAKQLIFTVGSYKSGKDSTGKVNLNNVAGLTDVNKASGYLVSLQQTDPKAYQAIVNRMSAAGADVSSFDNVQKNWDKALGIAANAYAYGSTSIDPFYAIDLLGAQQKLPQIDVTNTNSMTKNTTISTEQEARGALVTASQSLLGRDPTKNEVKLFTRALNSMQRANPDMTQTSGQEVSQPVNSQIINSTAGPTQLNQANRSTTSSSVSTGGFDSGQYTKDYAKSAKDYAEYQAETTYMDALMQAIQSPVNV
jgi:hypothetical protein